MKPAVLGGRPAFHHPVSFVRPALPSYRSISDPLAQTFRSGMLTKGPYLQEFELEAARHLGVKHAIGVSSCTMGLLLVYQALALKGEVVVPSFTFMATVHPLLWTGVKPVFVDVDAKTWNIDPQEVRRAITDKTSAIVAVHIFGNPAEIEELEAIAREYDLRLIFDSAHGFGSLYNGQPLGRYGNVEVFSTSPTKLVVTGEGGVVATNDDELAELIRVGREYGNRGQYASAFPGLNGRMQEFSSLLGLESLKLVEQVATWRNRLVDLYQKAFETLPGLIFQRTNPRGRSSYKDFTILIDEVLFGMSRDCLVWALRGEGIHTRNYYDPPVHLHETYRDFRDSCNGRVTVTEELSKRCLSFPMGPHLKDDDIVKIGSSIESIHHRAKEVTDLFFREFSTID